MPPLPPVPPVPPVPPGLRPAPAGAVPGALEALSGRAPRPARWGRRNSSKSARWLDCWSRTGDTRAPPRVARTRMRGQRVGMKLRPSAPVARRERGPRKMTAPRRSSPRALERAAALAAAPAALRAAPQAQAHVAAWLQPSERLELGDSRSPDRTSVTPGYLCRNGYTSPTIAQSLVLAFITSNRGRSESEEPSQLTSGPTGSGAPG